MYEKIQKEKTTYKQIITKTLLVIGVAKSQGK
jgi:hypothetical protein